MNINILDIVIHIISSTLNTLLEVGTASLAVCAVLFMVLLILQGIGKVTIHSLRAYKRVWERL